MKSSERLAKAEEAAENELMSGETLLWCEQPNAARYVFLQKRGGIWPLILVAALLVMVTTTQQPASLAAMLFLFAVVMLARKLIEYRDTRRSIYAITNQRVLITQPGIHTQSYALKEMGKISRRGDEPGDIIFGDASRIPARNEKGLFCIPHARQVEALLLSLLVQDQEVATKRKRLEVEAFADDTDEIVEIEPAQETRRS